MSWTNRSPPGPYLHRQPYPLPAETYLFSTSHQDLWVGSMDLSLCVSNPGIRPGWLKAASRMPHVQYSAQLQTSSLLKKTPATFWTGPQKIPIVSLSQGIPAAQWAYHSAPVKQGRRAWAPQGAQALPLLQTAAIYCVAAHMRACVCKCTHAKPTAVSRFTYVVSYDLEVKQILLAPLYRWGNWIVVNVSRFLYQTLH